MNNFLKKNKKQIQIGLYVALFFLIILGVFQLFGIVKPEGLVGKAVQATLIDDNTLGGIDQNSEVYFDHDGVNYLLKVKDLDSDSGKLMVNLKYMEICDDGIDNDEDGLSDCNDDDCFTDDTCLITAENKVLFKLPGEPDNIDVYPFGLTVTNGVSACTIKLGEYYICKNLEIYTDGVWQGTGTLSCYTNKAQFIATGISSGVRAVCEASTEELFCETDGSNNIPIATSGNPSDFTCYTPNFGGQGCIENGFEKCLYLEKKELGGEWEQTLYTCDSIITDIQGSLSYRAVCGNIELECSDGLDNNLDDLIDCEDPDCVGKATCIESSCDNGIDDNGNNWIDCSDLNCFGNVVGCAEGPVDTTGNVYFALNSVKANVGDVVEVPVYLERKANINQIQYVEFGVHFDNTKLTSDINADGTPDVSIVFNWMKEGINSDNPAFNDNGGTYETLIGGVMTKLPSPLTGLSQEDLLVSFNGADKINVKIDVPQGETFFGTYEKSTEILKLKFKILAGADGVVPVTFVEEIGKAPAYFNEYPGSIEVGLFHEVDVAYNHQGAVIAVANFEVCNDGINNDDGDELIDCADPDCEGLNGADGQVCEPNGETICDDGFDNNGDALVDCDDDGCDCTEDTELDVSNLQLNGIDATTDQIIIVGLDGEVRQFKDNTWEEISGISSYDDLFDVWVAPSGKSYIVGKSGLLIRVLNDGTFETIPTDTSSKLNAIFGINEDKAYIVGSNGVVLRYDGTLESVVQGNPSTKIQGAVEDISPVDYSNFNVQLGKSFRDLLAVSENKFYIVDSEGGILKYDNAEYSEVIIEICEEIIGPNGQVILTCKSNLESIGHESDYLFNGIWGSSESDLYVVGRENSPSGDALILHYDGIEWSVAYELDIGTYKSFMAITGSDANNIYTVGSLGTIVHYDGDTWSEVTSGTDKNLFDVSLTEDGAYIVGDKTFIFDEFGGGSE